VPGRHRLLLLAALLWCAGCQPPHQGFITDEQGRALVLHGTNLSSFSKSDPARLPSWLTRDDALRLSRDWGFNFVRFLILWDALEPQPGQIDGNYLDGVEGYLDWLHEAGVRVVLDMHQDVYSRVFCCDGAPAWAVRDDDLPFVQQPLWFANYFQPAVIRAWDNFWNASGPHADLQAHFAAAWAAVAARLGRHPAVLGYDVLNEPFPGTPFDLFNQPGGPMPAFERDFYAPFYQRVIAAIRAQDADGWIFFEPSYGIPSAGERSFLPPLDDPRPGAPRLAYFPHLYSITLEGGAGYNPGNDKTISKWRRSRLEDLERHGTPMLIGEFGVTDGVGNGLVYLQEVLDLADELTSGWSVWDYEPSTGGYSFIDSQKNEKPAKADVLVRVYPQAIAGEPIAYRYYPEARAFGLLFRSRAGVSGPTEISVPKRRHYPEGFEVLCSDPDGVWSWSFDAAREVLSVETDPDLDRHLIWIRPKQDAAG
jgi:endoglycosylceramidase